MPPHKANTPRKLKSSAPLPAPCTFKEEKFPSASQLKRQVILGYSDDLPKTELFPFLLWPASLHSGELLPFKVNVTSGSGAGS